MKGDDYNAANFSTKVRGKKVSRDLCFGDASFHLSSAMYTCTFRQHDTQMCFSGEMVRGFSF